MASKENLNEVGKTSLKMTLEGVPTKAELMRFEADTLKKKRRRKRLIRLTSLRSLNSDSNHFHLERQPAAIVLAQVVGCQ